MLRITVPRDIRISDFRRLRAHAAWYRTQVERFGAAYGARRFIRRARERARRDRFDLAARAIALVEPAYEHEECLT
jgi:hypothetical protein